MNPDPQSRRNRGIHWLVCSLCRSISACNTENFLLTGSCHAFPPLFTSLHAGVQCYPSLRLSWASLPVSSLASHTELYWCTLEACWVQQEASFLAGSLTTLACIANNDFFTLA